MNAKCERCGSEEWQNVWEPDGDPSHESLVCLACWFDLEGGAQWTPSRVADKAE